MEIIRSIKIKDSDKNYIEELGGAGKSEETISKIISFYKEYKIGEKNGLKILTDKQKKEIKKREKTEFLEYYETEEWKQRRKAVLKKAGHKCKYCGERARQAHHNTYRHFKNERRGELEAVCFSCHKKIHKK